MVDMEAEGSGQDIAHIANNMDMGVTMVDMEAEGLDQDIARTNNMGVMMVDIQAERLLPQKRNNRATNLVPVVSLAGLIHLHF